MQKIRPSSCRLKFYLYNIGTGTIGKLNLPCIFSVVSFCQFVNCRGSPWPPPRSHKTPGSHNWWRAARAIRPGRQVCDDSSPARYTSRLSRSVAASAHANPGPLLPSQTNDKLRSLPGLTLSLYIIYISMLFACRLSSRKKHRFLKINLWCYLVILLLLLKPTAHAQVGNAKLFINCFRNPSSTCAMENGKTQLREATNVGQHPWSHSAFRCQTQCREGRLTVEPEPSGRPSNLRRSTSWYFKLQCPIKDWGRISVGLSEHLHEPEIVSRLNQPGVCLNSQVMTMDIGIETA